MLHVATISVSISSFVWACGNDFLGTSIRDTLALQKLADMLLVRMYDSKRKLVDMVVDNLVGTNPVLSCYAEMDKTIFGQCYKQRANDTTSHQLTNVKRAFAKRGPADALHGSARSAKASCAGITTSYASDKARSCETRTSEQCKDHIHVVRDMGDYFVVWKPAGVSTCTSGDNPSELDVGVVSSAECSFGSFPRACYTLSKAVAGLIIYARTQLAFEDVKSLLQNGSAKLCYLAVCGGEAESQSLNDPEGLGSPVEMHVLRVVPSPKFGSLSLVSLVPKGCPRPKQLRRSLLNISHGVLGSTKLCLKPSVRGAMISLVRVVISNIDVEVKPPERFVRFLNREENAFTRVRQNHSAVDVKARHEHFNNTVNFGGLQMSISEGVFAPRQSSLPVVEAALYLVNATTCSTVLDVGTGSGCILLSILSSAPSLSGVGIDFDPNAIATAWENALLLGLSNRTHLKQLAIADLGNLEREHLCPFDIIVANLPYLPNYAEKWYLLSQSLQYEPRACYFAGQDGLDAFRELSTSISKANLLRPGGFIVLEVPLLQPLKHSQRYAKYIAAIFEAIGFVQVSMSGLPGKAAKKVVALRRTS